MKLHISSRLLYRLGCLFSIGLVSFSLYLEFVLKLEPCSLCLIQRWIIVFLGVLCAIGIFLTSRRRYIQISFASIVTLIALLGAVTASRKIWLEHLPHEQLPPCAPGLQFMLDHFPFYRVVQTLFESSVECGKIEWQFWGMALSEWTLMAFLVFIGLGIWLLFRRNP